jgi:flagellar protein FlbD
MPDPIRGAYEWFRPGCRGSGGTDVITLHKLSGEPLVLNAELIETVESTPDTLITLVDRRRLMVAEPVQDVVERAVEYRRHVGAANLAAMVAAAAAHE